MYTIAMSLKMKSLITLFLAIISSIAAADQRGVQPQTQTNASMNQMNETDRMDMAGQKPMRMEQPMRGAFGNYSMTRESSGTSWQPEAVPMEGYHFMHDDWMFMLQSFAFGVYDYQGGPRGDKKFFSPNMFMGMAQHPLGAGTIGFRAMMSLEAATIGRTGYPELLQTGETPDGVTPLIDRQHPHDLFMELATTYSYPVNDHSSAFVYFGYPGEPALGPATFMHRFSGMDIPEAPITHHWLDSTHITFGVATLGYIWKQFKIDASIFTGREPDQNRWNFDEAKFDSYSARLTWNATKNWSAQISYGYLHSPEQLTPNVDQSRLTASVSYQRHWDGIDWGTTLAFGEDFDSPGNALYGLLVESTVIFHDTHTLFARAENVQKDELFLPGDPRDGDIFNVGKISAGYIYDFPRWYHVKFGVGGLGSIFVLPESLHSTYHAEPLSFMLFVRAKL